MAPSLSLAQGKGREGNGGLDHVYDSRSCCLSLLPTLPFPESHGWLIMEQSCCPLICVCVTCPARSPPQLWWIICDRVTGAHGHSAPWPCLASASAESIACPGRVKRGQARLCWDLPSLSPEARRDQACMGGPVWGSLLLIELLTQPLALGDTSVSLPMINLNFIHRPRPLPDLVRPRSMCWDIYNKRARSGKGKGWAEGQGKIWWWWQNISSH